MKALVDADVLVDFFRYYDTAANDSRRLIRAAFCEQFTLCFTEKTLTDVYSKALLYEQSEEDIRDFLNRLLNVAVLISVSQLDFINALYSHSPNFYSAVLTEAALRLDIDCIVSRNKEAFPKSAVPVYSPTEFLKVLHG